MTNQEQERNHWLNVHAHTQKAIEVSQNCIKRQLEYLIYLQAGYRAER